VYTPSKFRCRPMG